MISWNHDIMTTLSIMTRRQEKLLANVMFSLHFAPLGTSLYISLNTLLYLYYCTPGTTQVNELFIALEHQLSKPHLVTLPSNVHWLNHTLL